MPQSKTKYHLCALDRENMRAIDEVFDTLESMIAKYGKNLNITRRNCEIIRRKTHLACTKYKHVCIEEMVPEGTKTYKV